MPALHRVGGRIKRVGERVISPIEKVQRKLVTSRERSRIVKEWAKTLVSGELNEEQMQKFSKLNKEFRLASVLEALKRAKDDEIDNLAKNLVNFTRHPELRSMIGEGYKQAKKELDKAGDDNFWSLFALMLSIYAIPLLPASPPHSMSTVRKVMIGYEAYNLTALSAYFLTLLRMRGKKKVAEKYRKLLKRYKELYQQINR